MLGEYLGFGGCEEAIKSPQNRERKNYFAILVALVWPPEQVADAPDEGGEVSVILCGQVVATVSLLGAHPTKLWLCVLSCEGNSTLLDL